MKLQDIIKLTSADIKKYSLKEQRSLASRLASAANKRIKRAVEKGIEIETPKFSIKGVSNENIENQIRSLQKFLSKGSLIPTKQPKISSNIQRIIDTPYEQWIKYDKDRLKKEVQQLGKLVNSRLRSLKQANLETPASSYMREHGGNITVKNKGINELRAEFKRAKDFLDTKTGTVSGAREWQRKSLSRIEEQYGFSLSIENFDLLWKTYEKAKVYDSSLTAKEYKYEILEVINNLIIEKGNKLTSDDFVEILKERNLIISSYEKKIDEDRDPDDWIEYDDVEDVFDLGERR